MRRYNFIREQLVEGEYDIAGHIAYSIYKGQKIELIANFKTKYNREPNEEEIATINEFCNTSHNVESYKAKAERILADSFDIILREGLDEQEARLKEELEQRVSAAVKKNSYSEIKTILLGIASSFAFSIIVAILFFMGKTSESGNWFVRLIEKLLQ